MKRKIEFPGETIGYERTVIKYILERAKENERAYPTLLQEDQKALLEEGLSYKRKCSLNQIIGEKKSLYILIQMLNTSLTLLNCKTKEEAKEKYYCIVKENILVPYSAYIEKELLNLTWI